MTFNHKGLETPHSHHLKKRQATVAELIAGAICRAMSRARHRATFHQTPDYLAERRMLAG